MKAKFDRRHSVGRRRHWSWSLELECGHQIHVAGKLRRPLSRKELEILCYGDPYYVDVTYQDYEWGREITSKELRHKPVPDARVIAELLPPPEFWGCRRCPRDQGLLLRMAQNLGPTRECLEHSRRNCRSCAQSGSDRRS